MDVKIEPSWNDRLKDQFDQPYFKVLADFVRSEYLTKQVYPPPARIFSAFNLCHFNDVKVVILGQDPYHGAGQANGLCFSVSDNVRTPPSLQNIYKEIQNDLQKSIPESGNLERWAKQGVLLLNATLTVVAKSPGSHQQKGWETLTDAVIQKLSDERKNLVFMLWGNYAKVKGQHIDRTKHLVLQAAHPSPYSAANGFFGCKHFSKTNEYLKEHGSAPIDW